MSNVNWLPEASPSKASLIAGINASVADALGDPQIGMLVPKEAMSVESLDTLSYESLVLIALTIGYQPTDKMAEYIRKYVKKTIGGGRKAEFPESPTTTAMPVKDKPEQETEEVASQPLYTSAAG